MAGPNLTELDLTEPEALLARYVTGLGRLEFDGVDADRLGSAVGLLCDLRAAADAAMIRAGVRADQLAADRAGPGCRETLLAAGRVRGVTAGREARRAKLAARSEVLTKAMGSGDLGSDHLDALVRHLGRLGDEHLGRVDVEGVVAASGLPADMFGKVVRRAVDDAAATFADDDGSGGEPVDEPVDENVEARADSEAHCWFDHRTGRGHLSARLDPERYEAVRDALEQHTTALANQRGGGTAKDANLAAEALVDLICSSGERSRHLPEVIVVVDEATLAGGRHDDTVAETSDGQQLTDDAVARLCCDAVLRRVVVDAAGIPVDVGHRHRTATDAQWSALRAIYTSCFWKGCEVPVGQCQAHHIDHWENGGPTDLINLVPGCSHHHHLLHEGGWSIEMSADRSVRIYRPDGQLYAVTSPPTRHRRPPQSGAPPLDGH